MSRVSSRQTFIGLAIEVVGLSVLGYVVWAVVHGAPLTWQLVTAFSLPMVIGALVMFPDEMLPAMKDLASWFSFRSGGSVPPNGP